MTATLLESPAVDRFAALANLPAELKERRQFVAWNLEPAEGRPKPAKVPRTIGHKASTTSPVDWLSLSDACQLASEKNFTGVGLVFTKADPYVALDFDDMTWAEVAPLVADLLPAYVEVSQSGHGIHVICRGALPGGARRKGQIEIYSEERYFALTGNLPDGVPAVSSLEDRTPALAAFHAQHLGGGLALVTAQPSADTGPASSVEDLDRMLTAAESGSDGALFHRLFVAGETRPGKTPSDSDLNLACLFAKYTRNTADIAALMAESQLQRPKWAERHGATTYLERTIKAALLLTPATATPSTADGPLWVPAAELAANPALLKVPESVSPWLVWRGDFSFLVGREKRGKSTLAASDATAALRQGRHVLWITAEEGANRVVSRFVNLRAPLANLTLLRRWPQSWQEVEAAITACHPDAVYVDSLSSFLMAVDGEVPQTSEGELWQAKVLRFKRWTWLAPDHPCGVTVLVHATKADGSYRGSSGIGAGPETIITLRDVSQDPQARRLETVGRWSFPSRTVRFQDAAAGYIDAVGATEPAPRPSAERQKALDALRAGMTWSEWLTAYGGSRNTFESILRWLKSHGRIVQRDDRTYALAPADPAF